MWPWLYPIIKIFPSTKTYFCEGKTFDPTTWKKLRINHFLQTWAWARLYVCVVCPRIYTQHHQYITTLTLSQTLTYLLLGSSFKSKDFTLQCATTYLQSANISIYWQHVLISISITNNSLSSNFDRYIPMQLKSIALNFKLHECL